MPLIPKKQQAFTLIELIMVIVILGVLSALALPRFSNLSKESKVAVITAVSGAMRSGISIVHASAVTGAQNQGNGSIVLNGVNIPVFNGYPAVSGSSSFVDINNQVQAWLEIDSVDRDTANANRDAAVFFTDKSTANNQIYIFFSEDYDQKSVSFGCQIRYQNPPSGTGPEIRLLTSAC